MAGKPCRADSRLLQEEVAGDNDAAASDGRENVAQKRDSRRLTRSAPTKKNGMIPSFSDDSANRPKEARSLSDTLQALQGQRSQAEQHPAVSNQTVQDTARQHTNLAAPRASLSERLHWSRISTKTWFWELLGILVGFTRVASIFGLLLVYDGKATPRLPYHVTVGDSALLHEDC